jgi:hypothetical protein
MQERLGFMDNEFDFESRYFPLGARNKKLAVRSEQLAVIFGWFLFKRNGSEV